MKIEIFMEDYFRGGVDTFVINLINNWPNPSDEFVLICNRKHSGLVLIQESITRPFTLVKHDMKIFTGMFEHPHERRVINRVMDLMLKISSPVIRYIFFIYNIFSLKRILLKHNPDRLLVVNNGYPAGDSCRAATIAWGIFSKKPYSIHNFHGIALKPGWHIMLQERLVDVFISKFSSVFVSVSAACASSMSSRKEIYRRHQIKYIYNGIDFAQYPKATNPLDLKSELGIPLESGLCLMLGAYHYNKNFDKGHHFLFQAFKKVVEKVPSAHLLICGHGYSENIERVRRLALSLKLDNNIHLSGFRNDIPFLLKHTDILLIASQVFESFGLVAIEAMAYAVPVVTTNVGAIPEVVINNEGGYCVDRNDIDAYAEHVIKLLNDDGLRKKQGQKGFQRYNRFFTGQCMAKEYAKLIHNG